MKPCQDCQHTREGPAWALHCPTCLWCGARLIQRLQRLPRPRSEITDRCRTVMADWVAMGHIEQELRALAKAAEVPLQPLNFAPPSQEKPRSVPPKSKGR